MKNFWLMFAIQEATTVAEVFINQSGLTADQKKALENLVIAGNAAAAAFGK